MFVVRRIKTGKFLKAFSGSFNKAEFHTECKLARKLFSQEERDEHPISRSMTTVNKLKDVKQSDTDDIMYCLKTPNGAQIYKNKGAIANSIGNLDGLEIVPVKIIIDRNK